MPARPIPVNATAAAILGLLHDGPMTGGELVAAAGERFGGFFSVTRSQVYRELPALAEAGLLRLGKLGAAGVAAVPHQRGGQALVPRVAGRARAAPTRCAARSSCACCTRTRCPTNDRDKLVATSRSAYADRLKDAQEAVAAAEDPCERAVAEFTVAHLEAMLTLLDAIPTAAEHTA